MATCPNGHETDWEDYCQICGAAMGGDAPKVEARSPLPATTTQGPGANLACPNCAEGHGPDDVFCESCGYDFASGSLPSSDPATASPTAAGMAIAAVTPAEVQLRCDRAHFDRIAADGPLDYPDPEPDPVSVPLAKTKVLIGRASKSRGVFPDIDLGGGTFADPGASSRHAVLELAADGNWTITDLQSTNGTYLDGSEKPLPPGVATPIGPDTEVNIGAWTSLTIT